MSKAIRCRRSCTTTFSKSTKVSFIFFGIFLLVVAVRLCLRNLLLLLLSWYFKQDFNFRSIRGCFIFFSGRLNVKFKSKSTIIFPRQFIKKVSIHPLRFQTINILMISTIVEVFCVSSYCFESKRVNSTIAIANLLASWTSVIDKLDDVSVSRCFFLAWSLTALKDCCVELCNAFSISPRLALFEVKTDFKVSKYWGNSWPYRTSITVVGLFRISSSSCMASSTTTDS